MDDPVNNEDVDSKADNINSLEMVDVVRQLLFYMERNMHD